MWGFTRLIPAIAIGACLAAAPPVVNAGDKAKAQKHFKAGKELMKVEDFAGAMTEFEASVTLFPTKNGLFNLGNCLKALHRYGEARETFLRLEREFGKQLGAEMRDALVRNLEEIRALIAELVVQVNLTGATVRVDGEPVGESPLAETLLLGPGPHTIEVSLAGFDLQRREVKLVSGDRKVESFKLERARSELAVSANVSGASVFVDGSRVGETPLEEPPPVPSDDDEAEAEVEAEVEEDDGGLSALFWVSFSATLACGVTAGGMWLAANSEYDKFKKEGQEYEVLQNATGDQYHPEDVQAKYQQLLDMTDTIERRGKIATGFGIAAGALAVVTTVILAVDLAGDDEEPKDVALAPTPGGLALSF